MYRCNIQSCMFYWAPLQSYFPGVMWQPLFDGIEACAKSLETYAGFAHGYLKDHAALFEVYMNEIVCSDNSHIKEWEFEESGIQFFKQCENKECTLLAESRIAAREDMRSLVAAVEFCRDNYAAVERAYQEQLHPLYTRLRNTSDAIRRKNSVRVGYSYDQYVPYSLSSTRCERVEVSDGWSCDLLRAFMDPLCRNISINFTQCPHHTIQIGEQMDTVD